MPTSSPARRTGTVAAAFAVVALALTRPPAAWAAGQVALPDMKVLIPAADVTVGTNTTTGHRELRFTHVTWNAGAGPFELDPAYDPVTGQATVSQALYAMSSPGAWAFARSVPLAATMTFVPPFLYEFPLDTFVLYHQGPGGALGAVAATSPKTAFCMTGDTYIGGVPNTPAVSAPNVNNCNNPNLPLGWSVGWGDEYDYTDNGENIDLTGVADGTYVLRAIVDPDHLISESDTSNNLVDTTVRIAGTAVTVVSQTAGDSTPPSVALTAPADGSSLHGVVTLSATAFGPRAIASVQFLLDGLPLGSPVTAPPYTLTWDSAAVSAGPHQLSARATDVGGFVDTASPAEVFLAEQVGGFDLDQQGSATGTGTVTVTGFRADAGERLLAFAGSDGPSGQTVTVSGAGLTWTLAERSNGQPGDAEVWSATTSNPLVGAAITSSPAYGGYDQQLTVVAVAGAAAIGSTAAASARSGAPSVTLRSSTAGSLALASGSDWDNAIGRTTPAGQTLLSQWVDSGSGDTFWAQRATATSTTSGAPEVLADAAPTTDRWNLAAVELLPAVPPPPDLQPPVVAITAPMAGSIVQGTIPVTATATDDVAVASVQLLLDGMPLGAALDAAPYAYSWDTTTVPDGTHTLSATAVDTSGNSATAPGITVTVANTNPPPMVCFKMDAKSVVHGTGTVTTPAFHTGMPGETLYAFVSADGPDAPGAQTASVTGAGLAWSLVRRSNGQPGDAEIWQATAPAVLSGATVTSHPTSAGYHQSLTVIAMQESGGAGASAAGSAASGAPIVTLSTTKPASLVFAVGHDWDNATARILPPTQVMLDQWVDTNAGDTDWSQNTATPALASGTKITMTDAAPTTDRWDMAAVEVTGAGS